MGTFLFACFSKIQRSKAGAWLKTDSGLPGELKVFPTCIAHQFLMPPFPLQLTMDKSSPTQDILWLCGAQEQQPNWYELTPPAKKRRSQAQQPFSLTHASGIKLGLTALLRECGGASCCWPSFFCQSCQAEVVLERYNLPCDISDGKQKNGFANHRSQVLR